MTSKIKLIIYTEDALLGSDSSGKGISKAFSGFYPYIDQSDILLLVSQSHVFYSRRDFHKFSSLLVVNTPSTYTYFARIFSILPSFLSVLLNFFQSIAIWLFLTFSNLTISPSKVPILAFIGSDFGPFSEVFFLQNLTVRCEFIWSTIFFLILKLRV